MRYAWLLIPIALLGCKRESNRSPAEPIVGCYSVTESRDRRYQPGDRICLLERGIIVDSTGSLGQEAIEVEWTATGNDFVAIVPPARTGGSRVELSVKRIADGKLDFRGIATDKWMTARLERSSEASGKELLEHLEACRACVVEGARDGGQDRTPPTPIYSLRSCMAFLRVTGAPCSALGMKGR